MHIQEKIKRIIIVLFYLARWNPVGDRLDMVSDGLRDIVTGVVLIDVAVIEIMH